ncbi:MAG: zinc ribbon domain-containing protein, partial [Clostridia bacterium]
MAYCVECGVELAPSEKACPLCGTPVSHPSVPWREPDSYPYPKNVEELSRRINIRYGAHLATILLLIPIAVTLLVDLMEDGQMTWSSYVLGAGLCLFCIVLLPFYVKQAKPYLFLLIDILAVGLYLLLIGLPSVPMALAGAAQLPSSVSPDLYVLALPQQRGHHLLALLAYLGSLSAATGMMILSGLTLSIMLGNHGFGSRLLGGIVGGVTSVDLRPRVLAFRRAGILAVFLMSWLYSRAMSGTEALSDFGLMSFTALS